MLTELYTILCSSPAWLNIINIIKSILSSDSVSSYLTRLTGTCSTSSPVRFRAILTLQEQEDL